MNIQNPSYGDALRHFKDFTKDLPPALRGTSIDNSQFIKSIHNSFARRNDMLNIDLAMKEKFDARSRQPKQLKRPANRIDDGDYVDQAFHYITYLPVGNEIWKLDGLDRQPQKFGPCAEDSWLDLVAPVIAARMMDYAEQSISFNLLCLVKDPLVALREELVQSLLSLHALEEKLVEIEPEWLTYGNNYLGTESRLQNAFRDRVQGPSEEYNISTEDLTTAQKPADFLEELGKDNDFDRVVSLWKVKLGQQARIKNEIKEEMANDEEDQRKADDRRHNFGPFIREWLSMLAEKGKLKELCDRAGYQE
ncbi:hypothetical protein LTS18_010694 [Coniosporium uncinatum]|uniref:Uncharacterized protein n=1 Tax=Coniosporium uncinatum TaxID=93489 RepID=A0ACC3DKV7_9PEZI|nr:hypothetical protein LTS18_010694 [Coniosporium uncinatum]